MASHNQVVTTAREEADAAERIFNKKGEVVAQIQSCVNYYESELAKYKRAGPVEINHLALIMLERFNLLLLDATGEWNRALETHEVLWHHYLDVACAAIAISETEEEALCEDGSDD